MGKTTLKLNNNVIVPGSEPKETEIVEALEADMSKRGSSKFVRVGAVMSANDGDGGTPTLIGGAYPPRKVRIILPSIVAVLVAEI